MSSSFAWSVCEVLDSPCGGSSWLGSLLMWASEMSCSGIPPSTDHLAVVDNDCDRITSSLGTGLDIAALDGFLLGFSWLWWEWVDMLVQR